MTPSIHSQRLLGLLPCLRRYARAVTGSQEIADAVVLATIQTLSMDGADPSRIDRVALYQCFSQVWSGQVGEHIRSEQQNDRSMTAYDKNIACLPGWERLAFVLSAVEDFNHSQIAEILEIPMGLVPDLMESVALEIKKQVKADVLIIEDELFISAELEDIMLELGHNVISVERTRVSALRMIAKKRPGLVLTDIQLADGSSGLDAANDILAIAEIPIIFITAYPERLLTGLRPEPTFVLSKPFKTETVRAVVSQALFFDVKAKLSQFASREIQNRSTGDGISQNEPSDLFPRKWLEHVEN